MNWRNSKTHYGWLSAGLHWFMLLLLVAVYATMELREIYPKGSDPREALKAWHYMLGISVLLLAGVRLLAYLSAPVPAITPLPAAWQAAGARWMKVALYLFMFAMPLLGWMMLSAKGSAIPFFGFQLPPLLAENKELAKSIKEVHEAIATAGYFLVGLHAIAALYHHYVLRDDTLRRMLPGRH